MQDQQSRRLISPAAIAGFSALLIATGSGVAWWTWKTYSAPTVPQALEHSQPQNQANSNPVDDSAQAQKVPATPTPVTTDKTLQVYWLETSGNSIKLAPTPVKLTSSNSRETLLEGAMQQLLAGPSPSTMATTIPAGTQLLDLAVKPDGVHVNLSGEFTMGGGSTSMEGRLAQVLYTATSLNPSAPLWLSVDGKPLKLLGGEGLVVEQPITRQQFEKDFPVF